MKVLFVYSLLDVHPRRPLSSLQDIHIGISYLSSYLRQRGHETRLVVLSCEERAKSVAMVTREMGRFAPNLVAFTAVSTQYPFIESVAAWIKQRWPDVTLVIGGTHASLCPEQAWSASFDALCVGEGEQPLAELVEQLADGGTPGTIANLWIRRANGTVERTPPREFNEALDDLPFPDRKIWTPWVKESVTAQQVVLLGRGCPYSCTYCCNHALRRLARGRYVRFRSPDSIIEEIRHLVDHYSHSDTIYLQAETILLNESWLLSLCDALEQLNRKRRSPLRYACNYRVGKKPPRKEVFAALRRANVRVLEIGLESGSERLRWEVLKRRYSNDDLRSTVALARKYGMGINLYNMLGFPTETLTDHLETVALNQQLCPNRSLTSIFYPYPGTDLHDRCRREGLLRDETTDWPAERRRTTIDLPTFSAKQIQRSFFLFDWRIYRGRRSVAFRARRTARNIILASPFANRCFVRALPYWHTIRSRVMRKDHLIA